MARIKADPQKLYKAASACRDASSKLRGIASDVRGSFRSIGWEGNSRQQFEGKLNDWIGGLESRASALDNLASQIRTIAHRLEEADNSLSIQQGDS